MLAALVRALGDFELAEGALRDACAQALRRWPQARVPDDPVAWLLTVARNRAIDRGPRSVCNLFSRGRCWCRRGQGADRESGLAPARPKL
ncbi:sigma factor [Gandjariella thermophila]|uniref:RNA polymerase sigma-70 region 2 domain-containing protein n=1 Tax=Gandjariella thermophila TaxID=1931992 RepID=A0A4D4J4X0_9PSEU|nr:hypothetical protein GTS_33580 [Gandjariella thermophila]